MISFLQTDIAKQACAVIFLTKHAQLCSAAQDEQSTKVIPDIIYEPLGQVVRYTSMVHDYNVNTWWSHVTGSGLDKIKEMIDNDEKAKELWAKIPKHYQDILDQIKENCTPTEENDEAIKAAIHNVRALQYKLRSPAEWLYYWWEEVQKKGYHKVEKITQNCEADYWDNIDDKDKVMIEDVVTEWRKNWTENDLDKEIRFQLLYADNIYGLPFKDLEEEINKDRTIKAEYKNLKCWRYWWEHVRELGYQEVEKIIAEDPASELAKNWNTTSDNTKWRIMELVKNHRKLLTERRNKRKSDVWVFQDPPPGAAPVPPENTRWKKWDAGRRNRSTFENNLYFLLKNTPLFYKHLDRNDKDVLKFYEDLVFDGFEKVGEVPDQCLAAYERIVRKAAEDESSDEDDEDD